MYLHNHYACICITICQLLFFRMVLDLQENCDSVTEFPYALYPISLLLTSYPNIMLLSQSMHQQSYVVIKVRTLFRFSFYRMSLICSRIPSRIPYDNESSCLLGLPLALKVPQTSLVCGGLDSLGELGRRFMACLSVGF